MRLHYLLSLLLCAAFLAGCKSNSTGTADSTSGAAATTGSNPKADNKMANQIAGTWTSENPDAPGQSAEFTFANDGSYVMTAEVTPPGKTSKVKTEMKGTYKEEGKNVTLKMVSLEMTSADASMKSDLDKMNASVKATVATTPELPCVTDWKDKDNLDLIMNPPAGQPGKPQTYKMKRKA